MINRETVLFFRKEWNDASSCHSWFSTGVKIYGFYGFLGLWLTLNSIVICLFLDKRLLLISEQCYITLLSFLLCSIVQRFLFFLRITFMAWKFFDEYGKQCRTNLHVEKFDLLVSRFPVSIRHCYDIISK